MIKDNLVCSFCDLYDAFEEKVDELRYAVSMIGLKPNAYEEFCEKLNCVSKELQSIAKRLNDLDMEM